MGNEKGTSMKMYAYKYTQNYIAYLHLEGKRTEDVIFYGLV